MKTDAPVLNVFTIVINGMPWLPRIHEALSALDIPWRWTIVHGVADPVGDTAWCHRVERPADDGTMDALYVLRNKPHVHVIARPRWPGKTAMCNAALDTFDHPGVLMQIDADELWTPEQLRIMPALFAAHPEADGALFYCRYWVGPRRFVCQPNAFGNHTGYEWIRAWRYQPGQKFLTHEPPHLDGATRYVRHEVTARHGLVFDHHAYARREQIEFKLQYYGPDYDPAAWDRLQTMRGPVDLSTVLPWVKRPVMSWEV